MLAAEATARPLLVVVDDIQWAEQLLLELLSTFPGAIRDGPILVLCLARPERLENHPEWDATIRLEPLGANEADALAGHLLGPAAAEVRAPLVRASAGNPLFAEELVAWMFEGNVDKLRLPTSLSALLGARLDQLDHGARAALERGAIEGEIFHRGAVVTLSEPESRRSVPAQLEVFAERDLVREAAASFVDEAAFRFKHILVRDAAYQATAKTLRAALHEAFASWLERVSGERVTEYEEIIAYHLEQSYRYQTELAPSDSAAEALAAQAAEHLTSAGRRAWDRGDLPAAATLLARAAKLHEPGRLALLPAIAELRFQIGDFAGAEELLDEAAESARARGDEAVERVARVLRAVVASYSGDQSVSTKQVMALADDATVVLEQVGDDAQLALVLYVAGTQRGWLGHGAEAVKISERAFAHARQAGDLYRARQCLEVMIGSRAWGATPVSEVIAFMNELPAELRPLLSRSLVPHMHRCLMACYDGRFPALRRDHRAPCR